MSWELCYELFLFRLREQVKEDFAQQGIKFTYMPLLIKVGVYVCTVCNTVCYVYVVVCVVCMWYCIVCM